MARAHWVSIIAAAALVAGCDTATEPTLGAPFEARAVAELSPDVGPAEWLLAGRARVFPDHSVYRQEVGDAVYERPVTGLLMAPEGPDGRQIFLGVLSEGLRPGTYVVRDSDLGNRELELYGTVLGPVGEDGIRSHHDLTSGTLVIEATRPALRASFSLESTRYVAMPRNPPVGTTYESRPGWLQVDGRIGAATGP